MRVIHLNDFHNCSSLHSLYFFVFISQVSKRGGKIIIFTKFPEKFLIGKIGHDIITRFRNI